MSYSKKSMTENEKKAKLTVLKDANKQADNMMKSALCGFKDSSELKKHVKTMSDDSCIDFKNDSDKVEDPTKYGNVTGRHISDENIESRDNSKSVYDLGEIDAQLKKLMEQKKRLGK